MADTIKIAVQMTVELSREEYDERFGDHESVADIRDYVKSAAVAAVASEFDWAEVN